MTGACRLILFTLVFSLWILTSPADADVKLLKRVNDKWVPAGLAWFESSADKHLRTTDPSGVYRIVGLESGEYIVRVSEPTLPYDRSPSSDDSYSDGPLMVAYHPSATNVKEAQAVSVIEGSESSGIDIRMPERVPRTISGTLTYGPDNQPASFVAVLIEPRDEEGFVNNVVNTTVRTDNSTKNFVAEQGREAD